MGEVKVQYSLKLLRIKELFWLEWASRAHLAAKLLKATSTRAGLGGSWKVTPQLLRAPALLAF